MVQENDGECTEYSRNQIYPEGDAPHRDKSGKLGNKAVPRRSGWMGNPEGICNVDKFRRVSPVNSRTDGDKIKKEKGKENRQ